MFSIASPPARTRRACASPTPCTGAFTARMERELVEGRQVWIKMPYGDFVVDGRRGCGAVRRRHGHHGVHRVSRGLTPRTPHVGRRWPTARAASDLLDLPRRRRALRRTACRRSTCRISSKQADAASIRSAACSRAGCRSTRCGRDCARPLEPHYYISGPPPMLRDHRRRPARARHFSGGDPH